MNAIYKWVSSFKHHLYNRKFCVLSDSKPVEKYINTLYQLTLPPDGSRNYLNFSVSLSISLENYRYRHITIVDYNKNLLIRTYPRILNLWKLNIFCLSLITTLTSTRLSEKKVPFTPVNMKTNTYSFSQDKLFDKIA